MTNVNTLIKGLEHSLRDFFYFCECKTEVTADELGSLFSQYFSTEEEAHGSASIARRPTKKPAKKATKATKKSTKIISDSDDSDSDGTSAVSSKTKKAAKTPVKNETRRPKGKEQKPRDQQTPIGHIDLSKRKLPELKEYARERGIHVSGTKAQVIENLLNYEKEQVGGLEEEEEEQFEITVMKPKTRKRLSEPADKPRYDIVKRYGYRLIIAESQYFVIDEDDNITGYIDGEEEEDAAAAAAEDSSDEFNVDVHQLTKEHCELAKKLGLNFIVPSNLD